MVTIREQLSHALTRNDASEIAELQMKLQAALINQGMACRAMGFILFGRVSQQEQPASLDSPSPPLSPLLDFH